MGIFKSLRNSFRSSKPILTETSDVISVDQIYAQANLADKEKSIYKVAEIRKAVPDILPNETRKQLTISMMGIAKITTEEALADAKKRKNVLIQALSEFSKETDNIKTECNSNIEDLQNQITEIESQIDNEKKKMVVRSHIQEEQEKIVNSETKKVDNIKNLIVG